MQKHFELLSEKQQKIVQRVCNTCKLTFSTDRFRITKKKRENYAVVSGICIPCEYEAQHTRYSTSLRKEFRPYFTRILINLRTYGPVSIFAKDIEKLYDSSNTCTYCNYPKGKDLIFHLDHIIPRSKGGTNDLENLCFCCENCNRAKSSQTAESYINWLQNIPERIQGVI